MKFEEFLNESAEALTEAYEPYDRKFTNDLSRRANKATMDAHNGGNHWTAAHHHDLASHYHALAAKKAHKSKKFGDQTYHEALADSHKEQAEHHVKAHNGHKGLVITGARAGAPHHKPWQAQVED